MTQQPVQSTITPQLSAEVENEILRELAKEMSEEVFANLEAAFPRYIISPAVELPPRDRLERYLMRILEAYPADEVGRMNELANLLNPEYVDLYKQGLVAPPLSRPWNTLIHIPKVFEDIQRDLRSCYRAWAQKEIAA